MFHSIALRRLERLVFMNDTSVKMIALKLNKSKLYKLCNDFMPYVPLPKMKHTVFNKYHYCYSLDSYESKYIKTFPNHRTI